MRSACSWNTRLKKRRAASRIDPVPVFTPAQRDRLPEYLRKWIGIGLSTEPVDRDHASWALTRFYESAGLAEPLVIWAPCPVSALLSVTVYAAIKGGHLEAEADSPGGLNRIMDPVIRSLLVTAPQRFYREVQLIVAQALHLRARTESAANRPLPFLIKRVSKAATHAARGLPLTRSVNLCLWVMLAAPIDTALGQSWVGLLEGDLHPSLDRFPTPRSQLAAESTFGGPRWLGHGGALDYASEVLGLPRDRRFIDALTACPYFWVLDGICVAAERPTYVHHDEAGRLHSEIGRSVAYGSGWGWWHWHGTEVTQPIIEAPETITISEIDRTLDPELRRIMIERYRHGDTVEGAAAYLRDIGGIAIDHDERFGTLWRRLRFREQPLVIVEVINRTPEPDGSYKHHYLRVDPNLRPIHPDGRCGPPQAFTSRNAIASTFGLTGLEYEPELET
jgi:hypothetical protein